MVTHGPGIDSDIAVPKRAPAGLSRLDRRTARGRDSTDDLADLVDELQGTIGNRATAALLRQYGIGSPAPAPHAPTASEGPQPVAPDAPTPTTFASTAAPMPSPAQASAPLHRSPAAVPARHDDATPAHAEDEAEEHADAEQEEPGGLVQAAAEIGLEGGPVGPELAGRIEARRGGGAPLDAPVRHGMEGAFGANFADVGVHHDAEADALSRRISALAFTTGRDIFFRLGAYQPHSPVGQRLLAHELTHVVQQRGLSPGGGGPLTVGPAGGAHEQEADTTASAVADTLSRQATPGDAHTPHTTVSLPHRPVLPLTPTAPGVARLFIQRDWWNPWDDACAVWHGAAHAAGAVVDASGHAIGAAAGLAGQLAHAAADAAVSTLHWAGAVVVHGVGMIGATAVGIVQGTGHAAGQFALVLGKTAIAIGQSAAHVVQHTLAALHVAGSDGLKALGSMVGLIKRGLAGVPQAFINLLDQKARDLLASLLGQRVMAQLGYALGAILHDPWAFIRRLGQALAQGFHGFMDHVAHHLGSDVLGWVAGQFGGGLTIPSSLTPGALLSLAQGLLGLTYEHLRGMLVAQLAKHEGRDRAEQTMHRVEGMAGRLHMLIDGEIGRAWHSVETARQTAQDLAQQVLDGLKGWLVGTLITQGIATLVKLATPAAGALIEAVQAIYAVVQTIIDNASELKGIFNAIVGTFNDLAQGAASGVTAAAGAITGALVGLIPVALDFVAKLFGLGGLAGKIRGAIAAIQSRIDHVLDALIAKLTVAVKDIAGGHGHDSQHGSHETSAHAPALMYGRSGGSERPNHNHSTQPSEGGHGVHDGQGTDERTMAQKEHDLKVAIDQSYALLTAPDLTDEQIKTHLPRIQHQRRLMSLTLVTHYVGAGEERARITGVINPRRETPEVVRSTKVINALNGFKTETYRVGNLTFRLDRSGMSHILERHHPEFYNGTVKTRQSFIDAEATIEEIATAVGRVVNQNREVLLAKGTTGLYTIRGMDNGVEYQLGINNGRIGQFFPPQHYTTVLDALEQFPQQSLHHGQNFYTLDRDGLTHILQQLHPEYWNATHKQDAPFYKGKDTVNYVINIIESILDQNERRLAEGPRQLTVAGSYKGTQYIVRIIHGRIINMERR